MRILLTIAFTHFIYFAFTQVKGTLKDARDGKAYNTIEIGNQVWMAENLNVDRFRNGDPIKEITSNEEWVQAGKNGTPGWCYYNNDPANGLKYGKLYNWHAVNDPRGLAPEGWHVPSTEECKTLINQQGGFGQAGLKMKSSDTWYGGGGYNKDGFNGLAGGRRGKNGNFSSLGVYFFWWTSSKYNNEGADYCYLEKSKDSVKIELMYNERGFSVRCVKEKTEKESDKNLKAAEEALAEYHNKLKDGTIKPISKDAFDKNVSDSNENKIFNGDDIYINHQKNYKFYFKETDKAATGLLKDFWNNGQLKETVMFVDGEPIGSWRVWYSDGSIWKELFYKNGEPDGIQKEYHNNGRVKNFKDYRNGKIWEKRCYDQNGDEVKPCND